MRTVLVKKERQAVGIRVNIPEVKREELRTMVTGIRKSTQMSNCSNEIEFFSPDTELTGVASSKLKEYFSILK